MASQCLIRGGSFFKKMAKKTKTKPIKKEEIDTVQVATEDKNIFDSEGELVVDVFETDADFVVMSAIAGVQIKDLDISVEKDMVVIKGQRINPYDNPEKKYVYQECYFGPFSRKIVLPENIDTKAAQAQMEKGMLIIKIPKTTEQDKEEVKIS